MSATNLKLRCPLSECRSMKILAPSGGYVSGQMVKVEDVVGVIVEDAAAGSYAILIYKAPRIVVPCSAAATAGYAVGEKVYFDAADAEVNETASGNTLCGVVLVASALGDETVEIELDGTLGIAA